MMVRSRDDIYRMVDLKGKKIGLAKSLNSIKTDWWRIIIYWKRLGKSGCIPTNRHAIAAFHRETGQATPETTGE